MFYYIYNILNLNITNLTPQMYNILEIEFFCRNNGTQGYYVEIIWHKVVVVCSLMLE